MTLLALMTAKDYPSTPDGLSRLVSDQVSIARDVQCIDIVPGFARISLRLPWWTWLACGIVHSVVERRVRHLVDDHKAVGTTIQVEIH